MTVSRFETPVPIEIRKNKFMYMGGLTSCYKRSESHNTIQRA
jgi:hypothetical protein